LEGWYALHQVFSIVPGVDDTRVYSTHTMDTPAEGWTAFASLIGSSAHVMAMHFRPTLDAIGEAQHAMEQLPFFGRLRLEYSFLSVTEAGLYHITAQLAKDAEQRGAAVGDEQYAADVAARVAAERDTPHVQKRLYPPLPAEKPYVCFYPMDKRRDAGQNWYTLSLAERSKLMYAHGLTGRRYAGRVQQIITGAIGFDAWEWGVTLFAKDPLEFKKLVTDMRFDEVSAKYAEFGDFYVGRVVSEAELAERIAR
jgi:chlorite dismutase